MERYGEARGIVHAAILEKILSGELAPGARLRESDVAEDLGTSRTPVREALRSLAAEGFVDLIQNRGATVREWTPQQIHETYGLRAVLEGYGARLAANGDDPAALAQLQALQGQAEHLVATREPGYREKLAELNSQFHRTVIEMAGIQVLSTIVSNLALLAMVSKVMHGYDEADLQRSIIQHRDIIRGIVQHDGDLAGGAMSSHILAARPMVDAVRTSQAEDATAAELVRADGHHRQPGTAARRS